jgi:hypothetical protein
MVFTTIIWIEINILLLGDLTTRYKYFLHTHFVFDTLCCMFYFFVGSLQELYQSGLITSQSNMSIFANLVGCNPKGNLAFLPNFWSPHWL